jgi:hypothetical protein
MKNIFKLLEVIRSITIIALVAIIGFSFAACSDGGSGGGGSGGGSGGGGGGGGGGTFTLTGIPSGANGLYAFFEADVSISGSNMAIWSQKNSKLHLAGPDGFKVSDGKVSLPLYKVTPSVLAVNRYSGNDTVAKVSILFKTSDSFLSGEYSLDYLAIFYLVNFANGSASRTYAQREPDDD